MYCPRCGKQQVLESVRFCPNCGFRLEWVAELLARGGFLELQEVSTQPDKFSPRRRGIRQGAKLMFFSGVLLPIAFGLCFPADNPAPLLMPLTVFLAGLAWMLYFRLFGEESAPAREMIQPAPFAAPPHRSALPSLQSAPVAGVGSQPRDTSGRLRAPSVIEHTTNLLEHK